VGEKKRKKERKKKRKIKLNLKKRRIRQEIHGLVKIKKQSLKQKRNLLRKKKWTLL